MVVKVPKKVKKFTKKALEYQKREQEKLKKILKDKARKYGSIKHIKKIHQKAKQYQKKILQTEFNKIQTFDEFKKDFFKPIEKDNEIVFWWGYNWIKANKDVKDLPTHQMFCLADWPRMKKSKIEINWIDQNQNIHSLEHVFKPEKSIINSKKKLLYFNYQMTIDRSIKGEIRDLNITINKNGLISDDKTVLLKSNIDGFKSKTNKYLETELTWNPINHIRYMPIISYFKAPKTFIEYRNALNLELTGKFKNVRIKGQSYLQRVRCNMPFLPGIWIFFKINNSIQIAHLHGSIGKGPMKIPIINDFSMDINNERYTFKPKINHRFENNKFFVELSYNTSTKSFYMKSESIVCVNIKIKRNISKFGPEIEFLYRSCPAKITEFYFEDKSKNLIVKPKLNNVKGVIEETKGILWQ